MYALKFGFFDFFVVKSASGDGCELEVAQRNPERSAIGREVIANGTRGCIARAATGHRKPRAAIIKIRLHRSLHPRRHAQSAPARFSASLAREALSRRVIQATGTIPQSDAVHIASGAPARGDPR